MAANVGRNLLIKKAGTTLLGIRQKSVSINGSPIDITSDDDLGYRTLLSEVGVKSMDISFDGVSKDAILRDVILGGTTSQFLSDITVTYPDGTVISGDFMLTDLTTSGSTDSSVDFSGNFISSGTWVVTP